MIYVAFPFSLLLQGDICFIWWASNDAQGGSVLCLSLWAWSKAVSPDEEVVKCKPWCSISNPSFNQQICWCCSETVITHLFILMWGKMVGCVCVKREAFKAYPELNVFCCVCCFIFIKMIKGIYMMKPSLLHSV